MNKQHTIENSAIVIETAIGERISSHEGFDVVRHKALGYITESLGEDSVIKNDNSSSKPVDLDLYRKLNLNIGLFGFGCVGQGLYDVLNHSQGIKAGISKICVKDKTKARRIENKFFTYERNDVLQNSDHDLIVELIDDADAALDIVTQSLAAGRDVVTANKKMLADNFELLYRLQQSTGASLLYEAACAGSIPIIRTLEEYYDNELLSSIKGILNGSSNYILTKMELEDLSFLDALKEAQAHGFAESDPTLDVGGYDSKYKLCLLAAHGFGFVVNPNEILNLGIQNITEFDINYAKEKGLRIKLIACAEKSAGGLRLHVMPHFVPQVNPLSTVNYEFNGIEVEGVYSDKQFFSGKGAGSHPTGSAVLSDISAITYNYRYGYKKLKKREWNADLTLRLPLPGGEVGKSRKNSHYDHSNPLEEVEKENFSNGNFLKKDLMDNDFTIRLYIRFNNRADLDILDIDTIEEEHSTKNGNGNYIIASVGFESLFNRRGKSNGLFVCAV